MSSTALVFNLSKALLLPLDMVKHNIYVNSDLMKNAVQSMVVANQKTYLALSCYDEIEQQLLKSRERVRVVIRALELKRRRKKRLSRKKQG